MKSRKTGSIVAIGVAAIGAAVLICSRSVAVEAVYPVEHAAQVVRTGFWPRVTGLFQSSAANAENVRLRRKVAELSVLRVNVARLEAENARLRHTLGYASREPEKWLAAGVLSRGGGAAAVRDALRVDKGSLAGVREGAVVVAPEGLVGRVVSVTPHTSEVMLVTDPSLKVACEIQAANGRNAVGILSGGSDELLTIRHVRGPVKSATGARVITSGRGGIFPRGFEIGTFLFQTNDVRGVTVVLPRVDYSTLEDVFIRRAK